MTRDRNLQFRGAFSTGFFVFLQRIFPLSPGLLCNLVRKSPQNVEKIAHFRVEKNAQNSITSLAVIFFVPNHFIFGQFVWGAVMLILRHRDCLGIIFGRHVSLCKLHGGRS